MNNISKIVLLFCGLFVLTPFSYSYNPEINNEIENLIDSYLEDYWGAGNYSWSQSSPWRIEKVEEGSKLELDVNKRPVGSTIINLEVWQASKLIYRIPLSVKIQAFAIQPVAKENIERRIIVSEELIDWKKIEVLNANTDWPSQTELKEKNYWTKRNLRADQLITWQSLEEYPTIRHGDIISLISKSGAVTVETDGIALQDAYRGDRIKVENSYTGKLQYGVVSKEKTVLIEK